MCTENLSIHQKTYIIDIDIEIKTKVSNGQLNHTNWNIMKTEHEFIQCTQLYGTLLGNNWHS